MEGADEISVTVLAFVYVPLNLATSIFGMNLQQLNNNGQQIWVFIITAVAAILVTAGLWFCFEHVNDIKLGRSANREEFCGKIITLKGITLLQND